ncbi:protein FAM228B-like [Watersipora subatra]|uniref:protein FAM228B-like n=1 Tax=Watersipora subatra TaxID=2589382 RepID=UPI00355B6823
MTSMLCVQEPGGFVERNHKEYTDVLLKDSSNHSVFAKYFPDDRVRPRFHSKRPFSTPNPQILTDNVDRQKLMGHSMKLQAWLNTKSVSLIQEKSDIESRPVKKMYGAVLDREENLVKDMLDYVENHDYLEERKKEILHKNWTERVYQPIRKAIISEMDSQNYTNYKTRKDQLYREYIEHVNKKGHVFRDDFDASEYYAMGLHDNRPMVVPGMQAMVDKPLRDPTLLQETTRDAEDTTILRCTSGTTYKGKSLDKIRLPTLPLVPKGRHGTENKTWTAMPLTDIESPVRQASRKRMVGSNLKSDINFGNWSIREYGKETRDKEMGIQKRRQCPQPPFTSPKLTGGIKKRLPAAKESQKSRTLPFANPGHMLDYGPDETGQFNMNNSEAFSQSQQPELTQEMQGITLENTPSAIIPIVI